MASGTVKIYFDTQNPRKELVNLQLDTGDTYTSRKFNKIHSASVASNQKEASHGVATATFSGTFPEASVVFSSGTRMNCTLTLWGD